MGSKTGYFEKHSENCPKPDGGKCNCQPTQFPPQIADERNETFGNSRKP